MVHDTREIKEGLNWIEILSIVCACLTVAVAIFFIARRRKRKKRNEDVREDDEMITVNQLLTREQLEWRGESIVI